MSAIDNLISELETQIKTPAASPPAASPPAASPPAASPPKEIQSGINKLLNTAPLLDPTKDPEAVMRLISEQKPVVLTAPPLAGIKEPAETKISPAEVKHAPAPQPKLDSLRKMTRQQLIALAQDDDAVSRLTYDDVAYLDSVINPLHFTTDRYPTKEKSDAVVLSFINHRADFFRHANMVGTAAWLYNVLNDYTPKPEDLIWTPKSFYSEQEKTFDCGTLINEVSALVENFTKLKEHDAAFAACVAERTMAERERRKPKHDQEGQDELERRRAVFAFFVVKDLLVEAKRLEKRMESLVKFCSKDKDLDRAFKEINFSASRLSDLQIPDKVAKKLLRGFLDNYFQFDPIAHVKESKAATADAKCAKLVPAAAPETDADIKIAAAPENRAATLRALETPALLKVLSKASGDEKFLDRVYAATLRVPEKSPLSPLLKGTISIPEDTFYWSGLFMRDHWDDIMSTTKALYDVADIGMSVGVWEHFSGEPSKVDADYNKWVDTNRERITVDVNKIYMGGWVNIDPVETNRKRTNFFGPKTELLKAMTEKREDDAKFGDDVMKKIVYKNVAQNIRETGPRADTLKNYTAAFNGAAAVGVQSAISADELKILNMAGGNVARAKEFKEFFAFEKKYLEQVAVEKDPLKLKDLKAEYQRRKEAVNVPENAVQVDVTYVNATTGEASRGKIYTQAEKPSDAHPAVPISSGIGAAAQARAVAAK